FRPSIRQKGVAGDEPRRSLPVSGHPSSAARDHHGLTGWAALPWPTHATAQMPASAASAKNGTNGGTSAYAGTTGGGASLVYTGNSAALIPKRFNAAASPRSAACFCSLFKSVAVCTYLARSGASLGSATIISSMRLLSW